MKNWGRLSNQCMDRSVDPYTSRSQAIHAYTPKYGGPHCKGLNVTKPVIMRLKCDPQPFFRT